MPAGELGTFTAAYRGKQLLLDVWCVRLAEVDLVGDDLEVPGVVGQQRNPVDVGGGGDREVQCSAPWRSPALRDQSMQPPALARHGGIEGQRVEVVLDGAETAHPQSTCLLVAGDQHAEVQRSTAVAWR
jgi:hypothetical protein